MFNPHTKFELSPKLKLGVGRGYSKNKIFKYGSIICLVIAGVVTLNTARIIYNKTKAQGPNTQPQVLGASDTRTQNDPATIEFTSYTVQKGDTLFNVSRQFSMDWKTLAEINGLEPPFTLKVGQSIKIPKQ